MDIKIAVVLALAFIAYAIVTIRYSHAWRPLGYIWAEFVIGAALIVGATAWAAQLGLLPTWQTYQWRLIVHYLIAGVIVIPAHILHAVQESREAARRARETDGSETT